MSALDALLLQGAAAQALATATGSVDIDGGNAAAGQILLAQDAATAIWQDIPAASTVQGSALSSTGPIAGQLLTAVDGSNLAWQTPLSTKFIAVLDTTFVYTTAATWQDMPFASTLDETEDVLDASGGFQAKYAGYYFITLHCRNTVGSPPFEETQGQRLAVRIGGARTVLSSVYSNGANCWQAVQGQGIVYADVDDIVIPQLYIEDAPWTIRLIFGADTCYRVIGPF